MIRYFAFVPGLILLLLANRALGMSADSINYPAMYSQKEIKKEYKGLKSFQKLIKKLESANNEGNIDYQNSILEKLLANMRVENQKLNQRISQRGKKLSGNKKKQQADSTLKEDLPQAYNPDLVKYQKNENYNKEESQLKKQESGILAQYGKFLREQQQIIQRMEKALPLQLENIKDTYPGLLKDLSSFTSNMQDVIKLMRKEGQKK